MQIEEKDFELLAETKDYVYEGELIFPYSEFEGKIINELHLVVRVFPGSALQVIDLSCGNRITDDNVYNSQILHKKYGNIRDFKLVKKMIIKVTQEHIDNAKELFKSGKVSRIICCPIALALKEVFPGNRIGVGLSTFSINHETFNLSENALAFRHKFDWDGNVEPFEFEVYGINQTA